MKIKKPFTIFAIALGLLALFFLYNNFFGNQFNLPSGETKNIIMGDRTIQETDGTKHSIPLDEILSGGVPKDGIPSIDNPKFISLSEADAFLVDSDTGLSFKHKKEARFYPFQILVWHEIVNDTVKGDPVLVTYCPLCFTGIVFERKVAGKEKEFGVSGKLWKSNLLMYNREDNDQDESLWSQILGEAVVGPATGEVLKVLPFDIMKYRNFKAVNPDGKVLSRDTGIARSYGSDPYGDYYTSESVGFGATFTDDRLHPKNVVYGIRVNDKFKAYDFESIKVGITKDTFAGEEITIQKEETGELRFFLGPDRELLVSIPGFWFSWIAVHPDTELFN